MKRIILNVLLVLTVLNLLSETSFATVFSESLKLPGSSLEFHLWIGNPGNSEVSRTVNLRFHAPDEKIRDLNHQLGVSAPVEGTDYTGAVEAVFAKMIKLNELWPNLSPEVKAELSGNSLPRDKATFSESVLQAHPEVKAHWTNQEQIYLYAIADGLVSQISRPEHLAASWRWSYLALGHDLESRGLESSPQQYSVNQGARSSCSPGYGTFPVQGASLEDAVVKAFGLKPKIFREQEILRAFKTAKTKEEIVTQALAWMSQSFDSCPTAEDIFLSKKGAYGDLPRAAIQSALERCQKVFGQKISKSEIYLNGLANPNGSPGSENQGNVQGGSMSAMPNTQGLQ